MDGYSASGATQMRFKNSKENAINFFMTNFEQKYRL